MTGQPFTDVMDWTFEMIPQVMLVSCRRRPLRSFQIFNEFWTIPAWGLWILLVRMSKINHRWIYPLAINSRFSFRFISRSLASVCLKHYQVRRAVFANTYRSFPVADLADQLSQSLHRRLIKRNKPHTVAASLAVQSRRVRVPFFRIISVALTVRYHVICPFIRGHLAYWLQKYHSV